MKATFRQSMAWLHTWVGLVVAWVLFFVFLTGTASYVKDEITRWMEPEHPLPSQVVPVQSSAMLELALKQLRAKSPPDFKAWTITLPHHDLKPRIEHPLSISWEEQPFQHEARRGEATLDPVTGQVQTGITPRATEGGTGLLRMHYALHYLPEELAIWLVGICTMLMLVAVVTGVVIHKKIFTDFFTFRPGKGQRSWLDAHNIVSVMTLPFFLMITYTGLVFFMSLYVPAGHTVMYGSSDAGRHAFIDELYFQKVDYQPVTPPKIPMSVITQQAEQQWGKNNIASVTIMHPQGGTPYIELRRTGASGIHWRRGETLRFSALDGQILTVDALNKTALNTQYILLGLHEGTFADWWLRWLYLISGLLGCAVIGTGLILWTTKRRTKYQKKLANKPDLSLSEHIDAAGLRLVDVLNLGTLIGLPLGLAAYFWANRLLPVQMLERAQWEIHALFLVWGAAFLLAAVRPLKQAWLELLWLTCGSYALLPVLNALTTDRHLGVTLPYGDWVLAGFDLSMLGLAAGFAYMAIKVKRKWLITEQLNIPTTQSKLPLTGDTP
ncbi:PepSY-associated TM helix domain-containing protein [Alcaligenes parafaecalis]|uniref:PepSY-associated TM helix domain-containing protein n=1 Tax=Alcaligenes parafaecalis TaxID=171260 RepID=A0ABT3VGS7_9BURK|nr:PepSY-associated TM helix domain-containing protein [Alcaligenes parafaecalis]MCX5462697.1 PepSY-associated TM helix domain-containing protein [Alcaligenes parafaecalis]